MILNTQQIILLCLLVSFVTSIATGITAVSLLQQSPEPVTQTINRVIERTVETVTQQPIEDIKKVLTKELTPTPSKEVVTVVVNQEEQSINAVQKNENSVARIYFETKERAFVTMGIVLNAQGDILVDKRVIEKRVQYSASYGSRNFSVKYKSESETTDFVILTVQGDSPGDFVPATFGDANTLKAVQSIISLSGSKQTSVSIGEIVTLNKNSEGTITTIKTSVDPQNVLIGSVLLTLNGLIVGMKTALYEDKTVFVPINFVNAQITTQ